ncbi:MAG: GNAT family N-acetyltransferase [Flavimaricola sp.]|nr:GNAT family N-acetyltransferase [Flavimaricola sp.]
MTYDVRVLRAGDVTAFREIRLEALLHHPGAYGSTYAQWVDQPIEHYLSRIDDGGIFGLFVDELLQGILAYDRETGGNARHRASLHAAYVRPPLRGKGAIDALVGAVVARGRSDGLAQLELTVAADHPAAEAAYRRCGFVPVARFPRAMVRSGVEPEMGGQAAQDGYVDEILMILALDGPV